MEFISRGVNNESNSNLNLDETTPRRRDAQQRYSHGLHLSTKTMGNNHPVPTLPAKVAHPDLCS